MLNSRQVGNIYENLARRYLSNNGYEILEQNFRVRFGEIDIVAKNEGYLCFVEVKYRKNDKYGGGLYAVNKDKQKTIFNVAKMYLKEKCLKEDTPCRFDVVNVDGDKVEIIKNAFP